MLVITAVMDDLDAVEQAANALSLGADIGHAVDASMQISNETRQEVTANVQNILMISAERRIRSQQISTMLRPRLSVFSSQQFSQAARQLLLSRGITMPAQSQPHIEEVNADNVDQNGVEQHQEDRGDSDGSADDDEAEQPAGEHTIYTLFDDQDLTQQRRSSGPQTRCFGRLEGGSRCIVDVSLAGLNPMCEHHQGGEAVALSAM